MDMTNTAVVDTEARLRVLVARNPATGAELGRAPIADPAALPGIVAGLRARQSAWKRLEWHERKRRLKSLYRRVARETDAWTDAIVSEIGKPRAEALVDVVTTLDAMKWSLKRARWKGFRPRTVDPLWQRWMLMKAARIEWRPLGVIGLIGTWNYPLLLNLAPMFQALLAGNAVVWKPSELASHCGALLQRTLIEEGLEPGLVATVQGGADVGQALIDSGIDKCVFTGGIATGRRVLAELGARGIPAVAELSGFDAAIVLPDAPRDKTAAALAWAAFVGAGQTCVAIKRVYTVGDALEWAEAIGDRARKLRVGDPGAADVDIGPLISESACDRFAQQIQESIDRGAVLVSGGMRDGSSRSFHQPTVLWAKTVDSVCALEGCFGPVVIVREVPGDDEAVAAANSSYFGLAASVWGKDRRRLRWVADRLEAGMVTINDAVAPGGHAAAPFGGVKASGYGSTRGPIGLREFVTPVAVHQRRPGAWRPQVFPYSKRFAKLVQFYRWMFHR
jgi:acyl-CoA reductase-like NAD-dependent aldehyde dehydrogenase